MKNRMCVSKLNIRLLVSALMICASVLFATLPVSAAGFLLEGSTATETLYGTPAAGEAEGTDNSIESEKAGFLEEHISEFIVGFASQLNGFMKGKGIDLSLDGIVFGRMSYSLGSGKYVKADFTHFGLEENNPWGIIGATVYYTLRNVVLVLLPIILMIQLIMQLFRNTPKGRAKLKEMLFHTVFVFGLLFVLPILLDLFIYARDVSMYGVFQGLKSLTAGISGSELDTSAGVGNGIIDLMAESARQDGRLVSALVLLASVLAGFVFLIEYIRIALILTVCFGIFPLVAVLSFGNTRKLTDWTNVFFPNLMVPFIDMILVLIPSCLSALLTRTLGGGVVDTVVVGIIIVVVIWNAIAVRSQILQLLGFGGIRGGSGLGQMLNTLAHTLPHRAHNTAKEGTEEKETAKENKDKMETATRTGREMDAAVEDMIEKPDPDVLRQGVNGSETDKVLSDKDEGNVGLDSEDKKTEELMAEAVAEEEPKPGMAEAVEPMAVSSMEEAGEPIKDMALSQENGSIEEETVPEPVRKTTASEESFEESSTARTIPDTMALPPVLDENKFYDKEFASTSLDGKERDRARYENLARKDAIQERMNQNNATMKEYGYRPETYEKDRVDLTGQMQSVSGQIKQLNEAKQSFLAAGDTTSSAYRDVDTKLTQATGQYAGLQKRVEGLDRAENAHRANQTLGYEYAKCERNERSYAKIHAMGGGSAQTYGSAAEYKHQVRVDDIKREKVNYQNFDSKQYRGLISPEQEAKFRMERDEKRLKDAMVNSATSALKNGAKAVAGTSLGVMAMTATAYAGSSASIGSGYMAARAGARSVDETIRLTHAVANGVQAAKDSVMAEHRKGREATRVERVSVPTFNNTYKAAEQKADEGVSYGWTQWEEKEEKLRIRYEEGETKSNR